MIKSGYMIITFEFSNWAYAEIEGDNIKFWEGEGLPDYEGSLDGFDKEYPEYMKELIIHKAVKKLT